MRTTAAASLSLFMLGMLLPGCRTPEDSRVSQPIAGVSNPSIQILFDTTRALPESGTFGWGGSLLRVDPKLNVSLSEVTERLQASLFAALPSKGFTYTNQAPDYLVSFAVLSGAALGEAELNQSYGDLLKFPPRAESAPAMTYQSGVLILDVVARRDGHLLWRGAIKADIDMDLPAEKKQARCDGAIRELLRHYPRP
jgi:hypothetical protein